MAFFSWVVAVYGVKQNRCGVDRPVCVCQHHALSTSFIKHSRREIRKCGEHRGQVPADRVAQIGRGRIPIDEGEEDLLDRNARALSTILNSLHVVVNVWWLVI